MALGLRASKGAVALVLFGCLEVRQGSDGDLRGAAARENAAGAGPSPDRVSLPPRFRQISAGGGNLRVAARTHSVAGT